MNKTIYVRDERLWNKAVKLAEDKGLSMSELIAKALDEFMWNDFRSAALGMVMGENARQGRNDNR